VRSTGDLSGPAAAALGTERYVSAQVVVSAADPATAFFRSLRHSRS
jgi:hypothetical protein